MVVRVLAVLVACLLAGCSDPAPAEAQPEETLDPLEEATPEVAPIPDAPWTTYWFVGPQGLGTEDPGAGSIPFDCAWRGFAAGCDLSDNEHYSDPFASAIYLPPQSITLDLWLATDAVAVGNPVFDIAAWFGTTRGSVSFSFDSVVTLTPDAPTKVTLTLDWSNGPGIVLPAGESLMFRILGAYEPEGAGLQKLLVGADTPSGAAVTIQNLTDVEQPASTAAEEFTGTLQGGAFIQCDTGEERHAFTVGANATYLSVRIEGTPIAPTTADIDLDLFEGTTLVRHAGSPYPVEEILLMGPALEPFRAKQLEAGSTICFGGEVEYTITVEQG